MVRCVVRLIKTLSGSVDACGQREPFPSTLDSQFLGSQLRFGSGLGTAAVATVDEGHSLSETPTAFGTFQSRERRHELDQV